MITLQEYKAKRILEAILEDATVAIYNTHDLVAAYKDGKINENRLRRRGRPWLERADRLRGRACRIKEAYLVRMNIPQEEKNSIEGRYTQMFDDLDWAIRFIG